MTTSLPSTAIPQAAKTQRIGIWLAGASVLLACAAVVGTHFINEHWPYRYRNVEPLLEKMFASQIKITQYHRTYFPYPGFVASGLTLRRNSAPDLPPFGSIRNLSVQGTWIDLLLLRQRIHIVDVEGLRVIIPPVGSRANHEDFPPGSSGDFTGSSTEVDQLNMHDANLEIMRDDGSRYTFPIRQLVMTNVRKGQSASYTLDMETAKPAGRIQSAGKFGPINSGQLQNTPLSGTFSYVADLATLHGLRGIISTSGKFQGTLAAIQANAQSDIPKFAVDDGHPARVSGTASGTVNGLNGDIVLHSVEVHTGNSDLHADGTIQGEPKTTNLDLTVTRGRAEDLLRPFMSDEVPVIGQVWLRSHALLTPAQHGLDFLKRLQMSGTFDIPAEHLSDRDTQKKLSAFSERAQGAHPVKLQADVFDPTSTTQDVVSALKGRATIRNGVVSTDHLMFQIPGAAADLKGNFDLRSHVVHLLGDLRMQADVSHTTTGIKSALMKPLIPFFKKHNVGAVVPVAITGAPHHYKVSQNLMHEK